MGTKANPTVIGAFVVGAIALGVIGLLVFGSGQLFKKTTRAVCFFSGDTMGLNVGAPVKFKGVEIGSVAEIRIRIGEQAQAVNAELIAKGIRIPVIIDIDNEKVSTEARGNLDRARLNLLIDLGMRAQLVSQSMVTGLLLVQLDFHPDTPEVFVLPRDSDLAEIPTIPTTLQEMQSAAKEIINKLDQIKFDQLVESATQATDGVRDLVRSPGLQKTVEMLPETIGNLNQAVTDLRGLTTRIDHGQGPLLESLKRTSDQADAAVEQAQRTLASIQAMLAPNAPLAVDLATSLRAIASAARSVQQLADYLERHPSSVVRGRAEREE